MAMTMGELNAHARATLTGASLERYHELRRAAVARYRDRVAAATNDYHDSIAAAWKAHGRASSGPEIQAAMTDCWLAYAGVLRGLSALLSAECKAAFVDAYPVTPVESVVR